MSGYVGGLNAKQAAALQQFKENVKDVLKPEHDDVYLLRWLRARVFDLKKSEKMLRDSLEFRKKTGADTILSTWTNPEVIQKYYPGGYFGHDKSGVPIWIDCLGFMDVKGMFYSAPKKDMLRKKLFDSEILKQKLHPEFSKKFNKRIDQINLIFDMDGIGMKHLWKPAVDVFTEILSMFEANYPETLKTCWIINAPSFFPIAYNLVKPFLSADTKKKIQVLDSSWRDVLLKEIDADQLPKHWGGTATDPDGEPHCKSKVCIGGPIPESYHRQKENFVDMSNFSTGTVPRGGDLQLAYVVDEPGVLLRWQFWTEGMDIGFGLYRRRSDDHTKITDMVEVVPTERVNSHMVPEDGSYKCETIGTYIARFDNTYSWVNSKKVSYLIEILMPDPDFTHL